MKKILISVITVACLLWAASAFAIPALQLDISNAAYDSVTETVVSTGDSFTLFALLNRPGDSSGDFYISAAVTPALEEVQPSPDLGTFTFAGSLINVTADMVYGTPPDLSPEDPAPKNQDLQSHSVFETYYIQFNFNFNPEDKAALYNVEDIPGGFSPWTSGEEYLYYKAFEVDVSGLVDGYEMHFDLYNLDDNGFVGINAPFSHDAQSGGVPVPEPSTMLLLGAGLAGLGAYQRRRGKG